MNLNGKKLLIMGGNYETTALVQTANDMGIYTIVVDPNPDSVAKKAACKGYDIDGLNVDGIVEIAKHEKVDGVLVGVADILIGAYQKVCESLGFPCYATKEIVDVFTQKDKFKAKCEEYGIHGIPSYKLDANMKPEDLALIEYPVMVKPVDNGGGVGMMVCYNEDELRIGVKKAIDCSKSKTFIVEKYMLCDDLQLYYTFIDGEYSLSAINDRNTTDEQPGFSTVNLGSTYPSRHIDTYFKVMNQNTFRMFRGLGIKNGVLSLQAFFENDTFYVYDVGFRLQGEAQHLLLKSIFGYDQREMLINFALTGSMGDIKICDIDDPMFRGKYASSLWFLLKEGTIEKIYGIDKLQQHPCVVDIVQRLYDGDEVLHSWVGTEKQVLARVYIVCDSKEELRTVLKGLMTAVRVVDSDGNDMLLKGFDVDKALSF